MKISSFIVSGIGGIAIAILFQILGLPQWIGGICAFLLGMLVSVVFIIWEHHIERQRQEAKIIELVELLRAYRPTSDWMYEKNIIREEDLGEGDRHAR